MERITIAHGSGGKITHELIKNTFFSILGNDVLNNADDSALLKKDTKDIAFTTDSFVIKPIFFPGGDIGKLSVCGTVNDLAVCGSEPKYLSAGFIIEEGFEKDKLVKIVESMSYWAKKAGVKIVTGDTKVVEKGASDGIFINTSGIGLIKKNLNKKEIKVSDKIIITGTMGDHGIAVLSKRKGLEFESEIKSDCAPLNKMLMDLLEIEGAVKFMRDPTRGGLATTLNEIAILGNYGILLEEKDIPVSEEVRAASELLGLDPIYIANEGKAIVVVDPEKEKQVLDSLHKSEYGKNAKTIGKITSENVNKVILRTQLGVMRTVEMLSGEQMPRIC